MSAVVLRLLADPGAPVDMGGLLPVELAGKAAREVEGREVLVGNRRLPLAELFRVGAGDEPRLVVEGSTRRLDRLGKGMAGGRLEVEGDAGAYVGHGMTGGRIGVTGAVGDFAGASMADGVVEVGGDAGAFVGAALAGETHGMTGGAILVGGSVGERAGDRMRRGTVAVRGGAGDWLASRLIGGTIVIEGACGAWPGYAMRRGSVLLAHAPEGAAPLFAENGHHDLLWLALLGRHLEGLGWRGARPAGRVRRLTGDVTVGGKGEILVAG